MPGTVSSQVNNLCFLLPSAERHEGVLNNSIEGDDIVLEGLDMENGYFEITLALQILLNIKYHIDILKLLWWSSFFFFFSFE